MYRPPIKVMEVEIVASYLVWKVRLWFERKKKTRPGFKPNRGEWMIELLLGSATFAL